MVFRDRIHIIEILDDIYFKFSDKFKNNLGKNPWPFYRVQIGFLLYKIFNNNFNQNNNRAKLKYTRTNYKILNFYRLCKQFSEITFLKIKHKNRLSGKVLLFGYNEHYYQYNGKDINSYLSPFKVELEKKNIVYEELLLSHDVSRKQETELYDLYIAIYQYQKSKFLLKNLFNKINENAYKNADKVNGYFLEKGLKQHEDIAKVIYKGQINFEINYHTSIQFLKIVNPKLIWTYCFYDSSTMALIKAANYLKIDNVEYQHSIQPDEHFAYAKWQDIDLYQEFFPNKFWVWQQSDKERILRNFTGRLYKPKPIFGGNLFSLQEKEISYSIASENKNGVLITLQGEWIPPYLEEIIKEDEKFFWYFRLHPRYPGGDKALLVKFRNEYPAKIDIEDANNLTVYELFRKVKLHITAASGVALESKGFGIANIITGEFGLSAYKTEINSGLFSYCTDKDTIYELLYKKIDFDKNSNADILMERQILDAELNKLLLNEDSYL